MPTITIHNAETNEVIEREMNASEFAQWETDKINTETKAQEDIAKTAQRQALLDKLGITAEEAQLLLGGN